MAQVALCDDHRMTIEGQRRILERLGHQVVGTASNGRTLVEFIKRTPVDLVVMDVSMPLLNGLDALVRIREVSATVKCLIMSMHEDAGRIARAFAMGANGYLSKTGQLDEFEHAVAEVLAGRNYLSVKLRQEDWWDAVQQSRRRNGYLGEPVLSAREREALQLIGEELSHKQIAGELNLSIHTVRDHLDRVKEAYGIKTTAGLVKLSVRLGLTDL